MRMRPLLCSLGLLAAVAAVAAGCGSGSGTATTATTTATATTPTVGSLTLGIQDDALFTSAEPKAVPTVTALAPKLIRYNIVWSDIAPTKPANPADPADPAYAWTNADKLVALAQSLHAAVLLTIVDAPKWANGGKTQQFAPTDPATFGSFCGVVAKHFPSVSLFTIWNEPNRGQFLQPQGAGGMDAPKEIAALAKACIPAIKQVTAGAKVAVGPIASRGGQGGLSPIPFLARYRAAGGPRPDAVALNPYLEGLPPLFVPRERPKDGAVTIRNLDWLHGILTKAYGTSEPIWLTEFAVRTVPPVTDDDQATQLRQSVELVRAHYPYVSMLVWFLLRDQGPTDYWRSGLVNTAWARKPAFAVFRSLE
jgi:Cellulase (glycosyl hydrolase family 5)